MIPKNSIPMVAGLHFWHLAMIQIFVLSIYSGYLVVDYATGYRHSCARLIQIATWPIGKDQDSLFLDMLYVVNLFCFV